MFILPNPLVKMDKLPAEIYCVIFKHLNLKDLVNCKMVCKDWNSIILSLVKVSRLVIDYEDNCKRKWYFTNKLINNDLELCNPNLFLIQFNKSNLSNLKHLYIDHELPNFDLNKLNLFSKLIHLEIDYDFKKDINLTLNLPGLIILKILNVKESYLKLIDCTKLKVFCFDNHSYNYNNFNCLEIKHPSTIIHLETDLYGEELAIFKNVEHLETFYFKLIEESTLINLRSLKSFSFNETIENCCFDLNENNDEIFNAIKNILKRFMKQKSSLKMHNLKVYFTGVQITDNVDEINFDSIQQYIDTDLEMNYEQFYMNNYRRLADTLPFIYEVNYTNLMNVTNEIPNGYFSKFNYLKNVKSENVVNQAHFLQFLKNLPNLECLNLKYANLNQHFYNSLCAFCSLTSFILEEKEELQLNYEFLSEFKILENLDIDQELSLQSLKSLLKSVLKLKHINSHLYFRFRKIEFRIKKKTDFIYDLFKPDHKLIKQNVNLIEIVNYFEKLK